MEDILKEVKSYDAMTLREKLLENGVKVGPIAPASISLFQKRLANELCRLRGLNCEESTAVPRKDNEESVNSNSVGLKKGNEASDKSNQQIPSTETSNRVTSTEAYYAVCLPENVEQEKESPVDQLVFSDKDLALKTAKKYKGSRFKVFKTEEDAKSFSRLTAESAFQSPRRPSQEESIQEIAPSGESSPFKAPKPQELAQLRKTVEKGDKEAFTQQVWDNPRFLVSSGDTPAMFQEGPRYTAMHVAAMKNKPEICQAILDILEDPAFMNKLYPQSKNTEETQIGRINFLVDLYLNMPDKGNCESPLHMACKYGHVDVVEVLVAHPRTDKMLRNKYGETPKDLTCSRCTGSSGTVKKKIEDLLQGQCYVPLVRYEDNTAPPLVAQPWSPSLKNATVDIPLVTNSPRDPSASVRACAGPMSPTDASVFHKRWTTPPSQSPELARAYFNTKRSDSEKGLERIGRQLAHEMHVPWSEYWEFLDQFVDMSSAAGLDLLENYLKKRVWWNFVKNFKEKHEISGHIVNTTNVFTPWNRRLRERNEDNLNNSFESDIFATQADGIELGAKETLKDLEVDKNDTVKVDKKGDSEKDIENVVDSIVSPVTNLSQHFANMKLDESWSERATVDSTDRSVSSSNTGDIRNDAKENRSLPLLREKSSGSDSTTSYTTAAESADESRLSDFASAPSTPEVVTKCVCLKLKDDEVFRTLLGQVRSCKSPDSAAGSIVGFIVHVKDAKELFIDVISIPHTEIMQNMIVVENVEVETCASDLNKVQEGDLVEIGSQDAGEEKSVILAYLTRAHLMPKPGYIYGPQPTREDLNVSRALGDATISPECHPNVFHWKISLNKFLRDTNYRWQSPAKLKPRVRQASPLPSPLGKTSPVVPYGSPLGARTQPSSHVTSDVRTRLFPSILE